MVVKASNAYQLTLFGTPRLVAPNGDDVTPRLRKAQALLAFLALAGEQPVSREKLQDLLWQDRMPDQGRDSLKKALGELRKSFADAKICPLETDGGPVRLSLSAIAVDVLQAPSVDKTDLYQPKLLEGLRLRERNFEKWLSSVRKRLEWRHASGSVLIPGNANAASSARPFLRIGLDQTQVGGSGSASGHLVDVLLAGLRRALLSTGVFEIIDFRRAGLNADRSGIDMWLRLSAVSFPGEMMVDLSLASADGRQQIWSVGDVMELDSLTPVKLNARAATMADQIAERVRSAEGVFGERHVLARAALQAISQMFCISNQDLDSAEVTLREVSDALGSSSLYAWYAYLAAFQVEKKGRANSPEILDKADFLAARALEIDPTNPLTRALVAHVQSFVLRDLDTACELLEPVRNMTSQNVMLADTYGLLKFYTGDYSEAKKHAEIATQLGRWNPFRYAFTTSVAMSQLMLGDYDGAVSAARSALAQHPLRNGHRFEPTLRTLAAAYSFSGQLEKGRIAVELLERQTGKSALDTLVSAEDAPFPNVDVLNTVKQGLERLYV